MEFQQFQTGIFVDFWYIPGSFRRSGDVFAFEIVFPFFNTVNLITKSCPIWGYVISTFTSVLALIESTDSWAMNNDRGFVNTVVFLLLKKAFDTVDHDILFRKVLNTTGFFGPVINGLLLS